MSKQLILSLPKFLRKSKVIQQIISSYNMQIDYIDMSIDDIMLQLDLDKCTWILPFLEIEYGIAVDITKTLEERRASVKAKMRGTGIVNIDLLQAVADSWKNGEINVSFSTDGYIVLTFQGAYGVPQQNELSSLIESISNVKPAHLPLNYVFKFLLVKDVHGMKIKDLQQQKINAFAFREVI